MGRTLKYFQNPRISDLSTFAFLLTVTSLQFVDGANILFMHPIISYSHRQAMIPLANALADRGHTVTYFSPIRSRGEFVHPSIHDLVPPDYEEWNDVKGKGTFNIESRLEGTEAHMATAMDGFHTESCEKQLGSRDFQDWLSITDKIDLIVVDFYPNCALALGYKYKAKVIEFHTFGLWSRDMEFFQLPHEAGAVPMDCSMWRGCRTPMPFLDRVRAWVLPLVWRYYEWTHSDALYRVFEKWLNMTRKEVPSLYELQSNIALVFLTSNYVTEQAKSLPPMFVSVPGLHVREPGPLPDDIQAFIDSDPESEGFIYMSLGSLVRPQNLPAETQAVILETMKAFPKLKFFWTWDGLESGDTFKKVKNLMVKKWFPQQDLLGHPKIRGFVTQAGRPSIQESMSFGVPMVTFAVLGDQDYNAQRLEDIGVTVQLEITTVTADQFRNAIQEIVYNPVYKVNAVKQSEILMDVPMKPLDTAVWWTEYVLRQDDLSHLKPPGSQLTWYQRYWLDVYGFLLLIVAVVALITVRLVTLVSRFIDGRSSALHQRSLCVTQTPNLIDKKRK